GFTTEVSAWLVLALDGGDLGGDGGSQQSGSDVVYIDPKVFVSPSPTVACWAPCRLVWPSSTMSSTTTISFDPVDTTITVGGSVVTKVTVFAITTTIISFFDQTISRFETSSTFALVPKFKPPPVTISAGGVTTTVSVRPLSTSRPASTTTAHYSLGTTTTVSDGTTWTFSIDQITSMSTLDGRTSTSVTTTRTRSSGNDDNDDDDDDDDIIIFPIWLGTGGFYWSPVWPTPLPTPVPKPPIPGPPPVPEVPCFKLFGIFSIMCPPDKSKPTTAYTSGPPQPTCTGSCGTRDDGDDEGDEESSTCATATSTDNVVTGCYETGRATATGDYCPLVTMSPDEDEGTDGTRPVRSVGIVTRPPVVVIGENAYPVTSGSVYISGTWYGAPSVGSGSTVTTTINGQAATVYPGTTKRGIIVSTPDTGPTPPPNPGPTPTTTQGGGGGGGSPPAAPTAYVEVAFGQYWPSNVLIPDNRFRFYAARYGDDFNVCNTLATFPAGRNIDLSNPPFPDGTFELPSFLGHEECSYVGTKEFSGLLSCPDFRSSIFFKARCEWGPDVMKAARLPFDGGDGGISLEGSPGGGCGYSTNENGRMEEECPYRGMVAIVQPELTQCPQNH
ncbi:hypothetical protein CPLU01_13957, partial [Colletotrichum plurivorum]